MKHIIFYSGGLGSWMTANRVIEQHGNEDVILLFTDTLIEDNDNYRFIIETAAKIFGVSNKETKKMEHEARNLPLVNVSMSKRKEALEELRLKTMNLIPGLLWLSEQRDVWDVFKETRFLGNSRIAQCSTQLKQLMSKKYVVKNFDPETTTLYLGIDWTEEHRTKAPRKNWAPYTVEFPMCEEPLSNKIDTIKKLEEENVKPPAMYGQGYAHANCGGFCVRGGQGHFINLLEKNPELYSYHEKKEKGMQEFLERDDISILTRTKNGIKEKLTLEQLRIEHEQGSKQIDMFDIGGCGCFVDDEQGFNF